MSTSQFLYVACQKGAEAALKREISRAYPYWRFAFSRPGFLTFKWSTDAPVPDRWRLRAVFARTFGWSLGMCDLTNPPAYAELCEQWAPSVPGGRWDGLHFWQRELLEGPQGVPSVTDDRCAEGPARVWVDGLRAALIERQALAADVAINQPAERDQYLLDVIQLDAQRLAWGWHRVETFEQRWPGGVPRWSVPERIVSRAYLKMREALLWSGLPLRPGDACVEIGSSPGGACQALLEDGLLVTGIDPAPMDPQILQHPHFHHIQKRGADVRRREYAGYRWLFADSNVAPKHTLDTVESIVTHDGVQIEGLILTLKLMDWKLADQVGEYAQRVRDWGFIDIRCRQLACSHQEICLSALRSHERRRARPHDAPPDSGPA